MTDFPMITTEFSESIAELAKALAQFQSECPIIPKDKSASFRSKKGAMIKYSYSDLTTIFNKIRQPLSKAGLSVVQAPETVGNCPYICTTIMHTSGQWVRSRIRLLGDFSDMKGMGAAMTYGKRYALSSMLGISSDDDIDNATELDVVPAKDAAPTVTDEQIAELTQLLADWPQLYKRVLEHYTIASLLELPAHLFAECKCNIQAEIAKCG